jgi:hypothetical protein
MKECISWGVILHRHKFCRCLDAESIRFAFNWFDHAVFCLKSESPKVRILHLGLHCTTVGNDSRFTVPFFSAWRQLPKF